MEPSHAGLTGIAAALLFGSALAEPFCQVDPAEQKVYRLELTVPATFCADNQTDPSCKKFPKTSLIQLHGLWPNYTKGYPSGTCPAPECREQDDAQGKYCRYPYPPDLYSSKAWHDLNKYMAGTEKCLERHEWVKHGSCSPLTAPRYFDWSLNKTREISERLSLPADTPITKVFFDDNVARNLPELNGAFNLKCNGNRLETLYILYTWEADGPGKPIKNRQEKNIISCPNRFIVPSKPN